MTIAIQVYAISGSSFSVGLVGLFSLVPLVTFGLYGGAFADVMDRRRLALIAWCGRWGSSLLLVLQAALGWDSLAFLYAVVAVQGAFYAVNNPTRSAIIPRLLAKDLLPASNALTMASFNLGFTVGPLLGALANRVRRLNVRLRNRCGHLQRGCVLGVASAGDATAATSG